jgi:hypothetical protein
MKAPRADHNLISQVPVSMRMAPSWISQRPSRIRARAISMRIRRIALNFCTAPLRLPLHASSGPLGPALLHVIYKEKRAINQGWKAQPRCNQQVEPHALPLALLWIGQIGP